MAAEGNTNFRLMDMQSKLKSHPIPYNPKSCAEKAQESFSICCTLYSVSNCSYSLLFIIHNERTPKFRVRSATFENMISKNAENASFNMTMNTELGVNNANFGPYKYRNSTVYFYFNGVSIGEAFVSQGKTRFKSTKKFNLLVNLSTKDLLAKDSQLRNDLSSGTLILTSKSKLEGKVELMFVFKKKKSTEMDYWIG